MSWSWSDLGMAKLTLKKSCPNRKFIVFREVQSEFHLRPLGPSSWTLIR